MPPTKPKYDWPATAYMPHYFHIFWAHFGYSEILGSLPARGPLGKTCFHKSPPAKATQLIFWRLCNFFLVPLYTWNLCLKFQFFTAKFKPWANFYTLVKNKEKSPFFGRKNFKNRGPYQKNFFLSWKKLGRCFDSQIIIFWPGSKNPRHSIFFDAPY